MNAVDALRGHHDVLWCFLNSDYLAELLLRRHGGKLCEIPVVVVVVMVVVVVVVVVVVMVVVVSGGRWWWL
jgi:hypothetical protein